MHSLEVLLASSLSWILIHVKRLCLKIQGDNEVSTDESLMPLKYAWYSCMESRTWIPGFVLEARIEREHPYTCLRMLWKLEHRKTSYLKIALTKWILKVLTRKSWSAVELPPAPLLQVDCKTNSWVVITSIPSSTQREVCPIQCNVTMWIHVPWYV
jgi:hypothetical protein